jgi:hypothetical protein
VRAKLEEEKQKSEEARDEMRLADRVTLEEEEYTRSETQIMKLTAQAREAEESACHRSEVVTEKVLNIHASKSNAIAQRVLHVDVRR